MKRKINSVVARMFFSSFIESDFVDSCDFSNDRFILV
jgi:hypothetical protein